MILAKMTDFLGKILFSVQQTQEQIGLNAIENEKITKYLELAKKNIDRKMEIVKAKTKRSLIKLDEQYRKKTKLFDIIGKNIEKFRLKIQYKQKKSEIEKANLKLLESIVLIKEAMNLIDQDSVK